MYEGLINKGVRRNRCPIANRVVFSHTQIDFTSAGWRKPTAALRKIFGPIQK